MDQSLSQLAEWIQKEMHSPKKNIFFGRSGNYPGLEWINIYDLGTVVYVQIFKETEEKSERELKEMLMELFPGKGLSIVNRGLTPPEMVFLSDQITEDYIYTENSYQFYLDIRRPFHPGLFFDIEPARKWVLHNSTQKKVLNLFAFTCGFSVYAAAGGASSIINMDNNSNVLSRGRNNHRLNGQDLTNIQFEKKDVMKSFGFIDKKGPYDLIICDPPTHQQGSFSARKDYSKLVRRLKPNLSDKGALLLCLNDPFSDFGFLEEIIHKEGLKSLRRIEPAQAFVHKNPDTGLKVICCTQGQ